MRFLRATLILGAVSCALPPSARAQDPFEAPPPHLALVEGTVTIDREDLTEPAAGGVPLVPGDRVRTERGRAELLFPDGSAIDLDEYSTIELEGPTLLRMTSGRVLLFAAGSNNPAAAVQFQIDTPAASAQTDAPGEYRIAILGGPSGLQTEMAVIRGSGALVTEVGTMPLRSGERSVAWDNAVPSRPQLFNSARYDAFEQWAMALRDQRLGSQSAQYLPPDLRMYGGQLDRNGAWSYEAPYGNVWYPTVAPDWRPYYNGYWSPVPTYGWTWIGVDFWSWPTHHYGRWGYGRNRWFWIPDRRWAPAWVSWGGAPGYVSWCPLGFDNRPVFSLSVSVGNGYRGWSGWNGWTVVSRNHFGGRRNVHQFAVSPRSLPGNVGFVGHASAPVAAPRAVPRRGFGSGGTFAGDRRRFPNVVGRGADGRTSSAVGRRGVNGDSSAQGQITQGGRPTTITRSPQAVSRQPQTYGQSQQFEQGSLGNRPQAAVPRQPQVPSAQPQSGDRPSVAGQNRGVYRTRPFDQRATNPTIPSENRVYSARPRYERPSVLQAPEQPIAPVAPQRPEGPQYGTAMRRSEAIRPIQPVQPESPQPGFVRRGGGPISTQRPIAPPQESAPPQQAPQVRERQVPPQWQERQTPQRQEPQLAPKRPDGQQAPQRAERAAQPRQDRQSDQGRSRGQENQQSSSDRQQNGGGGGHARRR